MRFHMLPRACPGRFKCRSGTAQKRPDPVQMRPGSNQMRPLLVPYVCLSFGLEGCIGLLVHISIAATGSAPPALPSPASGAYSSASSLDLPGRSTTVGLRRGGIPLHKLGTQFLYGTGRLARTYLCCLAICKKMKTKITTPALLTRMTMPIWIMVGVLLHGPIHWIRWPTSSRR